MRRSHRVGGQTVKVAYVPRDQKGFEGDAGGRPDSGEQSGGEHRLDLGRHLRGILVEHEVAGVEPDQLGLRQVI